jgi:hypothetical protein
MMLIGLVGCASGRLVNRSEWMGQESRVIAKREVFHNLSMAVHDPNHVPTRTTMSSTVNMTFTDTSEFSATIPLNNISRSSGVARATIGGIIDKYDGSVTSETNAVQLRVLRDLYRRALYPDFFELPNSKFGRDYAGKIWLFWKNRLGHKGPERLPPADAGLIGSTEYHDFYTIDTEAFSDFYLATLGGDEELVKSATAKVKGRTRVVAPRSSVVSPPKDPPPPPPSSGPNFLFVR